jgi:hypothetical protein
LLPPHSRVCFWGPELPSCITIIHFLNMVNEHYFWLASYLHDPLEYSLHFRPLLHMMDNFTIQMKKL